MKTSFASFDPAVHLDNDDVIAEFLTAASEDPNPDVFLAALGDVAKARGMAQIAHEAGLGRESLQGAERRRASALRDHQRRAECARREIRRDAGRRAEGGMGKVKNFTACGP